MKSNYRDPRIQELRKQPFEAVCVAIVGSDRGPREVVHDLGKRVWVWSDYAEQWPASIVFVGDGLTNGYDHDGMRLVSVPEYMCRFMTEAEAEDEHACMEIDQSMLANAY